MRNIYQKIKKRRIIAAALLAAALQLLLSGAPMLQSREFTEPDCAAASGRGQELLLYPGGMPFGVKFSRSGKCVRCPRRSRGCPKKNLPLYKKKTPRGRIPQGEK